MYSSPYFPRKVQGNDMHSRYYRSVIFSDVVQAGIQRSPMCILIGLPFESHKFPQYQDAMSYYFVNYVACSFARICRQNTPPQGLLHPDIRNISNLLIPWDKPPLGFNSRDCTRQCTLEPICLNQMRIQQFCIVICVS